MLHCNITEMMIQHFYWLSNLYQFIMLSDHPLLTTVTFTVRGMMSLWGTQRVNMIVKRIEWWTKETKRDNEKEERGTESEREREEWRTDKTLWPCSSGQTGQDITKMPLRYYGKNNVSIACPVASLFVGRTIWL